MPIIATTACTRVVPHSHVSRRDDPGRIAVSAANGAMANIARAMNLATTTVRETASSTNDTTRLATIENRAPSSRCEVGSSLKAASSSQPAARICSRGHGSDSWGPKATIRLRVSAQSFCWLGLSSRMWPQFR